MLFSLLDFPIVIAGGRIYYDSNGEYKVEVFDDIVSCFVDPLPIRLSSAAGDNGVICGGSESFESKGYNPYHKATNKCWQLQPDGKWKSIKNMFYSRKEFTLTAVGDELFAIGGVFFSHAKAFSKREREVEKYTIKGNDSSWSVMSFTPRAIWAHCTATLNSSHLMVIGGEVPFQSSEVRIWLIIKFK